MVEDESRDVASEAAQGAPVNRDKRTEPGVIDGEIASHGSDEKRETSAVEAQAPPDAVAPERRGPGAFRAFLAGGLGGLIVSAIAAGAGYVFLSPGADLAQSDASRLAALEALAPNQKAAVAGLDKRVGALEASNSASTLAALDKRISALAAANGGDSSKIDAAAQAAQGAATEVNDLKGDVDEARTLLPALSARVAKLESNASQPQAAAAGPEIADLANRISKVEAALAAPKTETRAAPEKPTAGDNPAPIAIVVEALHEKLTAGAPFGTELAALQSLGIDPLKLAPLKALANGGPTNAALAASFGAIAPKALAAAAGGAKGSVWDRFLAHIRGLVQIHELSETAGDDPDALVSQIEAESRRGDWTAALAAFEKLPEPTRRAAAEWAAEAGARQQADQTLQSIRESAIEKLAAGGKS
jgi:hypothetical protein